MKKNIITSCWSKSTQPQEEREKDLQGELRCYRSCCELDKMRERGESEDRIFLIIKHTISEIRKEERELFIKEIKTAKQKWTPCKRKNCDNKEECERANSYIETIWNPTFDELIKKFKI